MGSLKFKLLVMSGAVAIRMAILSTGNLLALVNVTGKGVHSPSRSGHILDRLTFWTVVRLTGSRK